MTDSRGQGPFGTVYFPAPDIVAVQPGDKPATHSQLVRLPRRLRPMMLVVAALLVGLGVLISVAAYQRLNRQVQVLVVQRDVALGSVVTSADLGAASITESGVSDIPARQRNQVIGLVAGSALHPGTLLAAADLATSLPPARGVVLVGVSLRPSALLASGLEPGDHVTLVATPGVIGENSAAATTNFSMTSPVAGIIQAVNATPNQDGDVVVDVLVPAGAGVGVVQEDSTGQIGLVITKQAPR
jgi:SAF domain